MSRCKPEDVVSLLNEYDSTKSLNLFIRAASSVVDQLASYDSTHDQVMTTDSLLIVEAWLAAHNYAANDQAYQSKSTGGASGQFQGQTGMFFKSTYYGQRAMEMDLSGFLALRQKELEDGFKKKATVSWLGKPPSTQTVYNDRK